ncbi:porin [Chitinophagaceae bacterium LWZ2-11]
MSNKIVFMSMMYAVICAFSGSSLLAQTSSKDTTSNFSAFKRNLTFSGLLEARYSTSLTKDVDVNGKNFADGNGVTNGFSLKRVRFQANAQINDYFSAVMLVNFADFSSTSVSNKVLENAFIKYTLNRHFHVIAGQYRPFFGIEELIPADIIKSLDYSNQYYLFGNNGWQSFQMGVSIYGDINKENKMPLRYYVGVDNGNGRNQTSDNDNGKHVYARLEADPLKKLSIGINAGSGSVNNKGGYAWGADVKSTIKLAKDWSLELAAEYKDGTNFQGYTNYTGTGEKPDLNQFKMKGYYIFPNLRYALNKPRFRALEFSARYEYLDDNYKQANHNPRQTVTPMLALEFADNMFSTLQLGANIDIFKTNVPLTAQYSRSLLVAQFQIRF